MAMFQTDAVEENFGPTGLLGGCWSEVVQEQQQQQHFSPEAFGLAPACAAPGAWFRPLFVADGLGMNTTAEAAALKLQTPTGVFVDLRFPTSPARASLAEVKGKDQALTDLQIRLLAQAQDCSAGFNLQSGRGLYSRQNLLSWNIFSSTVSEEPAFSWRIRSSADGQSFSERQMMDGAMQRWERIPDAETDGAFVALRHRGTDNSEGVLLVTDGYFALALDRRSETLANALKETKNMSKAEVVEAALSANKKDIAKKIALSLEGSFGRVNGNGAWIVERSTFPWRETRPLFKSCTLEQDDEARVTMVSLERVGEFEVLDTNMGPAEIRVLFMGNDEMTPLELLSKL